MCVVVWSGGPENCQQSALASVLSEVPHSLFWSIHHMKKVKAPSSKARGKPPGAQIFYTSEYLPLTHTHYQLRNPQIKPPSLLLS